MTKASNAAYHARYSDEARAMPDITVYFLQASRCIRTVWLLEELGLPYKVEFADRVNQKAPQSLKDASGSPLGKFPCIRDGDVVVYESGAISDYLCDKYDVEQKMMPANPHLRTRTQIFFHASEALLLVHSMAILYARWNWPDAVRQSHPEALDELERVLSGNVRKDLDWLDAELAASTGNFLVGNAVTAADVMMHFSVDFTFARELGTKGGSWPRIEAWRQRCTQTDAYKRAVAKSGHTLFPKTT